MEKPNHFVPCPFVVATDRLLDLRVTNDEERQRWHSHRKGLICRPQGIFLTNAGDTGCGFKWRIERLVCMILNRTDTSSDMRPSTDAPFSLE